MIEKSYSDSAYEVTITPKIEKIIEPLKNTFNINYFSFQRCYWDLTKIEFSTRQDWLQFYCENQLYHCIEGLPKFIEYDYFFLDEVAKDSEYYIKVVKQLQSKFGIYNVAIFMEHYQGYSDFFVMGVPQEESGFHRNLFINIDYLNKFKIYFKEKTSKFIEIAKSFRYPIPRLSNQALEFFIDRNVKTLRNKIAHSKDKLNVKRYYLDGAYDGVYLTQREVDCILLLRKGSTYKEIGNELNLSHRTIHIHIDNIKRKLQCSSKGELLEILSHRDFHTLISTESQ